MKLNKVWAPEVWEDYVASETQDKKTLKRINALVKDIERNGCAQGIGKPEQLRGDLSGWWSRRIDSKNRLVYRIVGIDLEIAQCQSHYGNR
jgi:toxin YoeB